MRTDNDPYFLPHLYDMEYEGHDEDVLYYVRRAFDQQGRVLELGCGTGRLTLPIGRSGHEIVGVDYAQEMLDLFADKLQQEDKSVQERVQIQFADFTKLPDLGTFDLILWPFNAMHHCKDVDALRGVMTHCHQLLRPGGRLCMDAYLVDLELYDRDPDERFEEREFVDPRTGERLQSWEQGWWDPKAKIHHVVYVYEHEDGRQERSHLQLRMFDLEEIYQALHDSGFELEHQAEDFIGTPLRETSLKWVARTLPV